MTGVRHSRVEWLWKLWISISYIRFNTWERSVSRLASSLSLQFGTLRREWNIQIYNTTRSRYRGITEHFTLMMATHTLYNVYIRIIRSFINECRSAQEYYILTMRAHVPETSLHVKWTFTKTIQCMHFVSDEMHNLHSNPPNLHKCLRILARNQI